MPRGSSGRPAGLSGGLAPGCSRGRPRPFAPSAAAGAAESTGSILTSATIISLLPSFYRRSSIPGIKGPVISNFMNCESLINSLTLFFIFWLICLLY